MTGRVDVAVVVAVLLRERFMVAFGFGSNSGLVVVGYFELGCFSRRGLGLGFLGLGLGLGMSTTSLMFCTVFLQLALGIKILGFGW